MADIANSCIASSSDVIVVTGIAGQGTAPRSILVYQVVLLAVRVDSASGTVRGGVDTCSTGNHAGVEDYGDIPDEEGGAIGRVIGRTDEESSISKILRWAVDKGRGCFSAVNFGLG